ILPATGRFIASMARMAAVSSMRLLVVSASPPHSSFSCGPRRRIAPLPPGPGLPRQAPSVNISTVSSAAMAFLLCNRAQCFGPCCLFFPFWGDQTHAVRALDGTQDINASREIPPALAGVLDKAPVLQPFQLIDGWDITSQAATVDFEAEQFHPVLQAIHRQVAAVPGEFAAAVQ